MFNYIAIYKAAENGNFDALKETGKDYSGLNLNYLPSDDFSETSLAHWLLEYQQIELFEQLIIKGASLNLQAPIHLVDAEKNVFAEFSLAYLIAYRYPSVVTLLADQKFYFDLLEEPKMYRGKSTGPIFHLLKQKGQYDAIKSVLKQNPSFSFFDFAFGRMTLDSLIDCFDFNQPITHIHSAGSCTLSLACSLAMNDRWDMLDQLVQEGAKLDLTAKIEWKGDFYDQLTLEWILIFEQKWELLQQILNKNPDTRSDLNNSPINPNEEIYGLTAAWMLAYRKQWDLLKKLSKKNQEPTNLNSIPKHAENPHRGKSVSWLLMAENEIELLDELLGDRTDLDLNCAPTAPGDNAQGISVAYGLYQRDHGNHLVAYAKQSTVSLNLNVRPTNPNHPLYNFSLADCMIHTPNILELNTEEMYEFENRLEQFKDIIDDGSKITLNVNEPNRNGETIAWQLACYLIDVALNEEIRDNLKEDIQLECISILNLFNDRGVCFDLDAFNPLNPGATLGWLLASTPTGAELLSSNLLKQPQYKLNLDIAPTNLDDQDCGDTLGFRLLRNKKSELFIKYFTTEMQVLKLAPTNREHLAYRYNPVGWLLTHNVDSVATLSVLIKNTTFHFTDVYNPNEINEARNQLLNGWSLALLMAFHEQWDLLDLLNDVSAKQNCALDLNQTIKTGIMKGVSLAWLLVVKYQDNLLDKIVQKTNPPIPIDLNNRPESPNHKAYGESIAMLYVGTNRFMALRNYGNIAELDLNAFSGNKESLFYGYTLAGLISTSKERHKFIDEDLKFLSLQEVLIEKYPPKNLDSFQYHESLVANGYSEYIDSLRTGTNKKVSRWLDSELNLLQIEHCHLLVSQTIIQLRRDLETAVEPVEKDGGSCLELSTENINYNDERMKEDDSDGILFDFDPILEKETKDALNKIKKYSSELIEKCRSVSQEFEGYPKAHGHKAALLGELRSFIEFLQSFVKINVLEKTSEQYSMDFIKELAKEFENSIEEILKNEPSTHWYSPHDFNQQLNILMLAAFGHARNTETIIPFMHQMLKSAKQQAAVKAEQPLVTEKEQSTTVEKPFVRSPSKENVSPNKSNAPIYSPNKNPSLFGKSGSETTVESPNGKSPKKRPMPNNKLENDVDDTKRKRIRRALFPPIESDRSPKANQSHKKKDQHVSNLNKNNFKYE